MFSSDKQRHRLVHSMMNSINNGTDDITEVHSINVGHFSWGVIYLRMHRITSKALIFFD